MLKQKIVIQYDPKNDKSIYQVGNSKFVASFWDETACKEDAFNSFLNFLHAAGVSKEDILAIKPELEIGSITTADVTMKFFDVDGEFISELE